MADAGLDDLDPRLRQPLLDLRLQVLGHLGRLPAQRRLGVVVRVVRVAGGEVAQRRLALDVDEVLVVVHLEAGFGRLDDAPDDHRGNLDRVPLDVVHLQAAALEVPDAQGDPALRVEGVGPAEALHLDRAHVAAEQLQDLGFVGVDDEQPGQHDAVQRGGERVEDDRPRGGVGPLSRLHDDEHDQEHQQRQQDPERDPPGRRRHLFLADHRRTLLVGASNVISLRNHARQYQSSGGLFLGGRTESAAFFTEAGAVPRMLPFSPFRVRPPLRCVSHGPGGRTQDVAFFAF